MSSKRREMASGAIATFTSWRMRCKYANHGRTKFHELLQMRAEETFNTTFEVVAGVGDYASKSHFYHNLICKIERESRLVGTLGMRANR